MDKKECKQVWFADVGAAGGKLAEMKKIVGMLII